jgi:hypothetical protein
MDVPTAIMSAFIMIDKALILNKLLTLSRVWSGMTGEILRISLAALLDAAS